MGPASPSRRCHAAAAHAHRSTVILALAMVLISRQAVHGQWDMSVVSRGAKVRCQPHHSIHALAAAGPTWATCASYWDGTGNNGHRLLDKNTNLDQVAFHPYVDRTRMVGWPPYVDLDLGHIRWIQSVHMLMFWSPGRRYAYQRIDYSVTYGGATQIAYAAECTPAVFNPNLDVQDGYCPVRSLYVDQAANYLTVISNNVQFQAPGRTVGKANPNDGWGVVQDGDNGRMPIGLRVHINNGDGDAMRYIRFFSSSNNQNNGIHFIELQATGRPHCVAGEYIVPPYDCLSCAGGTWSAGEGVTQCTPCAAGRYRHAGSASGCQVCNVGSGTNTITGATSCTSCANGFADTDSSSSTPCASCQVGTYSTSGATVCIHCLAGYSDQDNNPATTCTSCSWGSYAPLGSSGPCPSCPAGRRDHDYNPSTTCITCPIGQYAPSGGATCTSCVAGTSDADSNPGTPCITCPPGTSAIVSGTSGPCPACIAGTADADGNAATPCDNCPVGQFAAPSSISCAMCQVGKHDHDSNSATPCQACPTGQYHGVGISCTPCPAGKADEDEESTTPCAPCPPGGYAPEGTAGPCPACPAGKADLDTNAASQCDECPSGRYTAAGYRTTCENTNCPAGTADTDFDPSTECASCDPGTFAPTGATVCEECVAGRADTDSVTATECAVCSSGTYVVVGQVSCNPCEPGTVDHDEDAATECENCEPGSFSPAGAFSPPGSSGCIICSAGWIDIDSDPSTPCDSAEDHCPLGTHTMTGSTSCESCEAGWADTDSNPGTSCVLCPEGHGPGVARAELPATNSTACIPCAEGWADLDSDSTTNCLPCAEGTYAAEGTIVCTECSAGWSDLDNDSATPCERCHHGSYQPLTGATACPDCEAGLADLDLDASTDCAQCTPGHTSSTAAVACDPCPPGRADLDLNQATACEACPVGTHAGSAATTCLACTAGRADLDSNSATICEACPVGMYTAGADTSCSLCSAGTSDTDMDPASPCTDCSVGTYAQEGSTACIACAAGQADVDMDPRTPCIACQVGSFAGAGGTSCVPCPAGMADLDLNAATVCDQCDVGFFSLRETSVCNACMSGTADIDQNASTACELCTPGYSSGVAASVCDPCLPGTVDFDRDPATPCDACGAGFQSLLSAQTLCVQCTVGTEDHDDDRATDCLDCPPGKADLDHDAGTVCSACDVGWYSPAGQGECTQCGIGTEDDDADPSTACRDCQPGMADLDINATTICSSCAVGHYSPLSAIVCTVCVAGRVDDDSNSATECLSCPSGQYSNAVGRIGPCDQCVQGRFAPSRGNVAEEACEACSSGQHSENGSASCTSCAPGTADTDESPVTPCAACPNGTYASCGSLSCEWCVPGQIDADLDPSTPCTECPRGTEWFQADDGTATGGVPGMISSNTTTIPAGCDECQAGKVDNDQDSTTPCAPCETGQYAASGSRFCESCLALGMIDDDEDASTPCTASNGICTQQCPQGTEDADCDATTVCTDCIRGQYSSSGVFAADAGCKPCARGQYAPHGAAWTDCESCALGRADHDEDTTTDCVECMAGTYTANDAFELVQLNATRCQYCPPGTIDDDLDSTTACALCPIGTSNPHTGATSVSACMPCAPGLWSTSLGATNCPECPLGTFRGADDAQGCVQCDASLGQKCEAGASFPSAAAGFFAETTVDLQSGQQSTHVVRCIPFPYACMGTCTKEVAEKIMYEDLFSNDDRTAYLQNCRPSVSGEACTDGYGGARCSVCTPFDPSKECSDTSVNGYYRFETRCEPCPCTLLTFPVMIGILLLLGIGLMFLLDTFNGSFHEHASTLAAPTLILISFCQTIAVFLDTGIPWPPFLHQLMLMFSFLNFNMEFTRPECAGKFGPLEKVQLALTMPVFAACIIGMYGLVTVVIIRHQTGISREQLRVAMHVLLQKLAAVCSTLFTVGAIFFVKSFLRAWDCVGTESDNGRRFLASAPEMECTDNPASASFEQYQDIRWLSALGLACFIAGFVALWLAMLREHRADTASIGMFAFLSTKYENDRWYWEMVIVLRKVLIMCVFLMLERLPAVLLATFITIAALSIHIAARPFEDNGTDWAEMLSLAAQLLILTAGPVFIVLSDPDSGMSQSSVFKIRTSLELAGAITLGTALGISTLVQVQVWRAIHSDGGEDEHDDFKIRTEARRLQALMAATEERKLVLSKLEEINLLKQEAKQHSKTTYSNPLEQGEGDHEPANLDSNFGVE